MVVRALIAMTAAALALLLAGCSGDDAKTACGTPASAAPAETALLPTGLSLDGFTTVTRVQKTQGHLTVRAVTAKPIDEVTVLIQDAVTAAGYRPAGMDNEGFEAEVFFTAGTYAAGQALVRRAACEGQWDIDLVLIDPGAVPSAKPSPARTTPG